METQIHPWKFKIDLLLQEQGKEVVSTGEKKVGFTCGVNQFDEMLQQVAWLLETETRKLIE